MPAPSKVDTLLPSKVKKQLNSRLIKSGFSGYESLSAWLAEQGFEISKSSLHRYGQSFEDRVAALKRATEQAKAIVEESPDDEGAMSEALQRLIQEKLFTVLLDLEVDTAKLNINSLGKTIAELGRASVTQKKYAAEVRARANAAAADVEQLAKEGGLSDEKAALIKKKILGISE